MSRSKDGQDGRLLLTATPKQIEKPRAFTARYTSLLDKVGLQQSTSRVLLPAGQDLVAAYMNALTAYPVVHNFIVQKHAEQMNQWELEERLNPKLFESTENTAARWMQILRELLAAVSLSDDGAAVVGERPVDTATIMRARGSSTPTRSV